MENPYQSPESIIDSKSHFSFIRLCFFLVNVGVSVCWFYSYQSFSKNIRPGEISGPGMMGVGFFIPSIARHGLSGIHRIH